MRKQIPNIITLLNLFSGTIAITLAFNGNFLGVVIWVVIAAIFDFFDGMAARALKAYSPLGKELDSLADVVSFGVAPASALFILMKDSFIYPDALQSISHLIPYIAFLIPVFAAYRLAKFNIDTRQSHSFIGLPTPANGLFWISYCYAIDKLAMRCGANGEIKQYTQFARNQLNNVLVSVRNGLPPVSFIKSTICLTKIGLRKVSLPSSPK